MVSSSITMSNTLAVNIDAKLSAKRKTEEKSDFDFYLKTEESNKQTCFEQLDNGSEKISSNIKEDDVIKDDSPTKDSLQTSQKDNVDETQKKDVSTVDEDMDLVSEETVQAAVDLFANIIQIISNYTGKTVEEVSNMMQDMGMEVADLLSNDYVNELVTELMDKNSIMELLTDTEMSSMIKELVGEIGEMKNQFMETFQLSSDFVYELSDDLKMNQNVQTEENVSEIQNDRNLNKVELETNIVQNIDYEIKENLKGLDVKSDTVYANNDIESNSNIIQNDNLLNEDSEADNLNQNTDKSMGQDVQNQTKTSYDSSDGVVTMTDALDNIRNIVMESIPKEESTSAADKIVNQIIDEIKLYARPNMTSLEMQLEPETLGKVTISILAKAGHISAEIAAQNQVAKEAIEGQLNVLKENLAQQGVKVEGIEVTIATHNFEGNLEKGDDTTQKQREIKRKKTISAKELAEINGEISLEQNNLEKTIMKQMGTTVSYLA